MIVLAVATFLSLVVLGLALYKPRLLKKLPHPKIPRKKALVLLAGATLVLLAFTVWQGWRLHQESHRKHVQQTIANTPPKNSASGNLPGYEILSTTTKGNNTRTTVLIDTTDSAKITALNEVLVKQYPPVAGKSVFIDYFNDRATADDYFAKLADKKTTTAQKQQLSSHYLALRTAVSGTKDNLLIISDIRKSVKQPK